MQPLRQLGKVGFAVASLISRHGGKDALLHLTARPNGPHKVNKDARKVCLFLREGGSIHHGRVGS